MEQLLLYLAEPIVLAYPDHNKEFIQHTDASGKKLGAALLQYQEVDLKVVCYGSKTLAPAEKKYCSSKLKFLGMKWIVFNQLRNYFHYAAHFHIYTYNNPVTCIISTGRLTATGQRWVNELAEFSFSLHYKPNKQNIIAHVRKLNRTNLLRAHTFVCRNSSS